MDHPEERAVEPKGRPLPVDDQTQRRGFTSVHWSELPALPNNHLDIF